MWNSLPSKENLHWFTVFGVYFMLALTFFSWFGMIHLTKLGLVLRSVAMSLDNCSLYNWPTVLNIPFLVRDPNMVSPPAVAPIPTISAANQITFEIMIFYLIPSYNSLSIFRYNSNKIHVIAFCYFKLQFSFDFRSQTFPTIFPNCWHECIRGTLHHWHHIFIQRIHILH